MTWATRVWTAVLAVSMASGFAAAKAAEPISLKNGTVPLPANVKPLTKSVKLVPGTPLIAEHDGELVDVTYLGRAITDEMPAELEIAWNDQEFRRDTQAWEALGIDSNVLKVLRTPTAKKLFASQFEIIESIHKMNAAIEKKMAEAQGGKSDPLDFQHGERVLPADLAAADAPRRRAAESVWIEVRDVRHIIAGKTIEFEARVAEGRPIDPSRGCQLVVKGSEGRSTTLISFNARKNNDWRQCSASAPGGTAEFWFEDSGIGETFENRKFGTKVSKSFTIGKVGQVTLARDWTPEESAQYDAFKRSKAPPSAPPKGFQVVDATTEPLLPGMVVMAWIQGGWVPAELIAIESRTLVYKTFDVRTAKRAARDHIAIANATLERGREDPKLFQPSIRVLEGGVNPLGPHHVVLTRAHRLTPGTPVLRDAFSGLKERRYVGEADADNVRITGDAFFGTIREETVPRASLALTADTEKQLGDAEMTAKWEQQLADVYETAKAAEPARLEGLAQMREEHEARVKEMQARMPARPGAAKPANTRPIEPDEVLAKGTPLLAEWGGRWWPVTTLSDSREGGVEISWDGFGPQWNEKKPRSSLLIVAAAAAVAEEKKPDAPAEKPAAGKQQQGFTVAVTATRNSAQMISFLTHKLGLDFFEVANGMRSLPFTVKQGLTKQEAESLKQQLESVGGTVTIQSAKEK